MSDRHASMNQHSEKKCMHGSSGGTGGPYPHGKSQVVICFFRNTGTDPLLEKQLDL